MRLPVSLCLLVSLTALLAIPFALAGCKGGGSATKNPQVIVAGHTFEVEIAQTEAERNHGLSGRLALPADHGMLFVFDKEQPQSFWMKDCYLPIDVAFIDASGKIVDLQSMAVEEFPPQPARTYDSAAPAKYVLETVGGTWQRIGAKTGMPVTFVGIPGTPK